MKILFQFLLSIIMLSPCYSQNVEFEDQVFKDYLVNLGIDTNGDGEIQIIEAEAVTELEIKESGASSIVGIKSFVNLEVLSIESEQVDEIDVSEMNSMNEIFITNSFLTIFNASQSNSLFQVIVSPDSFIDSLLLNNCNSLINFGVSNPSAENFIDLSNCTNLSSLNGDILSESYTDVNLRGCIALEEIHGDFNIEGLEDLKSLTLLEIGTQLDLEINNLPNLRNLIVQDTKGALIKIENCPMLEDFHIDVFSIPIDRIEIKKTPLLHSVFANLIGLNDFIGNNLPSLELVDLGVISEMDTIDLRNNISLSSFFSIPGCNVLDVSNCLSLEFIDFFSGDVRILNASGAANLVSLDHIRNVERLEVSGCFSLSSLSIQDSPIRILDLSSCVSLIYVEILNLPLLESLILKNGIDEMVSISDVMSLHTICADEIDIKPLVSALEGFPGIPEQLFITSECPFIPSTLSNFNNIRGHSILDINQDSCQTSDVYLPFSKYQLEQDGEDFFEFFTNGSGRYSVFLTDGEYSYGPEVLYGDDLFILHPASHDVSLPSDTFILEQDFCFIPQLDVDIIDVTLIPLNDARPGFDADYKIIYKNTGNVTRGGDIKLDFQDDLMDFISSSPDDPTVQEEGFLSWSFEDLIPYEEREIFFTMKLNSPMDDPPLEGGEILEFNAMVGPLGNQTVSAYWSDLFQEVVNSFDPNDKRNLDGDAIDIEKVGDYVKYMIRFENTGTASAVNIVVTDTLDESMFDVGTLEVIDASHPMTTKVTGNIAEFSFPEIYLPFDDANNDGYIVFMIKTRDDLVLGDALENKAAIYFDFNFPIITNLETTVVSDFSSVQQELQPTDFEYSILPNPLRDLIQVASEASIKVMKITSIDGQLIKEVEVNSTQATINVSDLRSGIYLIRLITDQGEAVEKVVKM